MFGEIKKDVVLYSKQKELVRVVADSWIGI
jgi:hypothetical protein